MCEKVLVTGNGITDVKEFLKSKGERYCQSHIVGIGKPVEK
jgi:hypothetical protein